MEITSHFARSARHTTHYLAAGPEHGPLLIFVHGWPELSRSWRHQLPVFGGLAILLCCMLAALLSIQRVLRLEPAIVFKG